MVTTKEFAEFICGQLRLAEQIDCRKMFGEYGVYSCGKLFALICDNRLLLKPTQAGHALLPNARLEEPYPGAKPMILVETLDDPESLSVLVQKTCAELPLPKPKRRKTPKDD